MRRLSLLLLAALAFSAPAATTASAPIHRFKVVYLKPRNRPEATIQSLVKLSRLSDVMSALSQRFILPRDVTVVVTPGPNGPLYDPAKSLIVFNDNFSALVLNAFSSEYPKISQYRLGVLFASVEYFVLFHEIGHAFVHLYDLPILGKEEDAVDAISTVFMTKFVRNGGQVALAAADLFGYLGSHHGKYGTVDFADEHSIDLQRMYDIACLVYGSNETKWARVGAFIPAERRARCAGEWRQKEHAFQVLLRPHIRPN
jgi:Putative metallopeptidase